MEVLPFVVFGVLGMVGLLGRRRVTQAVLSAEDRYGRVGPSTPERERYASLFVAAGSVTLLSMALVGGLLVQ
jgi:hypothetical protein